MTPPEMTSASLLLWIVLGITLQIALWLGISFWMHWGEYQALRTGVGPDGGMVVPVKETLPSASEPASVAAWSGFRNFRVDRKETEDGAQSICSFYLVPEDKQPLPEFKPGQFLTFRLDVPAPDGHTEQSMRQQVRQWVGIPVCVGIAETKTLAKLANHCAKKSLAGADSVCDLTRLSEVERSTLFATIDVGEVWGIGPRLSKQLTDQGISTVEALRRADPKTIRREFSVVVERTVMELNAVPCMSLEDVAPAKQQIMSSRSFGNYVYDLEPLKEAVASYVATAAEKLRGQGSVAGMIQVYVRTNPHKDDHPQYSKGLTIPLPEATDDTLRLTKAALWGLRRVFRFGYAYQKAGIVLMNLTDSANQQAPLFDTHRDNDRLMAVMDRINVLWGRGTLRSAATGVAKSWAMKREWMSPQYTTHWEQLPVVI